MTQRDLVLASLKCEHHPDVYVKRPKVVVLSDYRVTKAPSQGPPPVAA